MLDTKAKIPGSSENARPKPCSLQDRQLRRLKEFGERINRLGADFAVCDLTGEVVVLCPTDASDTEPVQLKQYCLETLKQSTATELRVCRFGRKNPVLSVVLRAEAQNLAVALVKPGPSPGADIDELKEFCSAQKVDYETLQELLSDSVRTDCNCLTGMLNMLAEDFEAELDAQKQTEMVSTELAQTYEELVLLHKLSTNMKVTESDANYLQMACDSLTDIVSVAGIAVLLERTVDDEKQLVVAAGSGLIDVDERMAVLLENRLADEIKNGRDALLDSEVDSPFRYDWPENIQSIIVVPLYGKERGPAHIAEDATGDNSMIGLMVAVNRIDKQDFDSTDAKLFNSVANGCAVFVENGRLFTDLKELLIGSLKALTSSIDAKDQYTRGHSERVAFISRWIAERLSEQEPLQQEQIHRIYLAGLLHDIGKMGIDEAILRKEGKLTEQEINHIRAHPSIGANILSEIKQMRDIVPGVLCHHERMDGKGYPNGLKAEQIPLIGKIIGLADGFDAMTSKRVYRDALTVEQALDEIKKGLGTQFDEKIATLFLNSNVYELWDAIQDGSDFIGAGGKSSFSEYGAVAVGTLIR